MVRKFMFVLPIQLQMAPVRERSVGEGMYVEPGKRLFWKAETVQRLIFKRKVNTLTMMLVGIELAGTASAVEL